MRTIGRESGFTMGVPPDMADQTTFLLSEPGGDASTTSPLPGNRGTAAAIQVAARPGLFRVSFAGTVQAGLENTTVSHGSMEIKKTELTDSLFYYICARFYRLSAPLR